MSLLEGIVLVVSLGGFAYGLYCQCKARHFISKDKIVKLEDTAIIANGPMPPKEILSDEGLKYEKGFSLGASIAIAGSIVLILFKLMPVAEQNDPTAKSFASLSNGAVRIYYESGLLRYVAKVKNEELEGEFAELCENEAKRADIRFFRDIAKHPVKKYNKNGKLTFSAELKDGKCAGLIRAYHPQEGYLWREAEFLDSGRTVLGREFYPNGKIKEQTTIVDEKIQGLAYQYDEQGNVLFEFNYKNNKREGICREFYPGTKQVKTETMFKEDVADGMTRNYSQDGKLLIETNYKDGLPEGKTVNYNDDGTVKITANVHRGEIVKTQHAFMAARGFYRDGPLVDDGEQAFEENVIENKDLTLGPDFQYAPLNSETINSRSKNIIESSGK